MEAFTQTMAALRKKGSNLYICKSIDALIIIGERNEPVLMRETETFLEMTQSVMYVAISLCLYACTCLPYSYPTKSWNYIQ